MQACAVMHYEAITRKQRYCRKRASNRFQKGKWMQRFTFCMHWITSPLVLYIGCYMDRAWLFFFFFVCLFFSSGHCNRTIIKKNIIYMSPVSTEKRIFVTSGLHLTSVFSACGNVFNSIRVTKVAQTPSPQSRSFKVFVLLLSTAPPHCHHETSPGFMIIWNMKRWISYRHIHHLEMKKTDTTFIDNTRFENQKYSFFPIFFKLMEIHAICNGWGHWGLSCPWSLKAWAWVGLKWFESEPGMSQDQCC